MKCYEGNSPKQQVLRHAAACLNRWRLRIVPSSCLILTVTLASPLEISLLLALHRSCRVFFPLLLHL